MARRRFLGLAAGAAATTGYASIGAGWPAYAQYPAQHERTETIRTTLAFLTDVHIQTDRPDDEDAKLRLKATADALEAENLDAILNAGDMTDYGRSDEYEAYLQYVEPLRSQMHHVPGNHATHFHWTGYETWEDYFGPRSSSFTIDGLHVVMLNTTVINQGAAYVTQETLEWLREDLVRAGRDRPALLVTHHPPLGEGFYFLQNQDELAKVIKPFRVRGIFCGHTHVEQLRKVNGLTVLVGKAHKVNTGYYRLDRMTSAHQDVLKVTYVALPDPVDGGEARSETPVTSIDLGSPSGPGDAVEPTNVHARVSDGTVRLHTRYDPAAPVASVAAALYDPYMTRRQWYGDKQEWTPLTVRGRSARGEVPLVAPVHPGEPGPPTRQLPPGDYRVMIRSVDSDGNQWRSIVPFETWGSSFTPLWDHSLGGSIHGSIAEREGLVVTASTTGAVGAFRPKDATKSLEWQTRVGPVYNDLAFSADGQVILAPSLDHYLYALDANTGSIRWRTDLRTPVSSDPLATEIDGQSRIIQTAGRRTYCLDSEDGSIVWHADIGLSPAGKASSSVGRPACDGDQVYLGCGTGYARAIDARTGKESWSRLLTPENGRSPTHAPWVSNALLMPGNLVMLGTVRRAYAMRRETGEDGWPPIEGGNFVRCHPAMVNGRLLVPSTDGLLRRLDPTTGNIAWTKPTARDALNAGIIANGTIAYTTSTSGIVNRVDVEADADTEVEVMRHISNSRTIATPALTDNGKILVAGDQAGVVRGFAT